MRGKQHKVYHVKYEKIIIPHGKLERMSGHTNDGGVRIMLTDVDDGAECGRDV